MSLHLLNKLNPMNVDFTFARNAERGAMNDSDTFWINCSHTIRSSTSTSLIKNKQTKTVFKHQHHRRHHKQQQQLLSRIPKVQAVLHLEDTFRSFLSSQTEVINEKIQ